MGSHIVTCHPAVVTFLPLPQLKLVLNVASQERCKALWTWVVDSLPAKNPKTVIYLRNNEALSWLGTEPA